MNKYLKEFLHRGLMFGGFGPIIVGIIYMILSCSIKEFSLNGVQMFSAILSTYIIAFLQAGASVFNQIEKWPISKSLLAHFSVLYLAYVSCYLINSWIPFEWSVVLLFTLIFVVGYFVIWFTVYFIDKSTTKKFNKKLG